MSPDTHDTPERGVASLEHTKPQNREKRESLTGLCEMFMRTGSIRRQPGLHERQVCGRDSKAGRVLRALVDAAAKVWTPFILGATWRTLRRPRPRWSAAASRKSMSTIISTFSGTEMTSSALLGEHDVVSAQERQKVCAPERRSVSARARVAAEAGQAGGQRSPQTPLSQRVMRRRTRQRQAASGRRQARTAIVPGGHFGVTSGQATRRGPIPAHGPCTVQYCKSG